MSKTFMEVINKLDYYTHVHDSDCPDCGFPETIFVRSEHDDKLKFEYCGKYCGYLKEFNE